MKLCWEAMGGTLGSCVGGPLTTVSLPSQVTSQNEAVAPSVQRCKVICRSRRSDPREETASPATTHCCRQRRRVGSGRNIKQLLAPEEIPVPGQVEGFQQRTQLLGGSLRCQGTGPCRGVLLEAPSCPKTHLPNRLQCYFQSRNHCFETQQPWRGINVRGPLTHDPGVLPVASQHNFIVQPLVTKEWNPRAFQYILQIIPSRSLI